MAGKRIDTTPRVMWLLNHTSARKFEIPMLRRLGYEVFTPKSYPDDPNFRSASVDFSEDENLTIPAEDLAILNAANWYNGATKQAWEVANKYFDICFFMVFQPRATHNAARRFEGALLWRTYGLSGENASYSNVIESITLYEDVFVAIQKLGKRFWFAEAYPHLHEVEKPYIADRAVFLPLGMKGAEDPISSEWNGDDKRILFVCPDVGFNPVYIEIYKKFKQDFKGFPYAIGGAQSVEVDDDAVLGYLPFEEHMRNMREMRVMFYHSQEPRHIHFHPFEAVKAGMPLVFMSGGILDQFGGKSLPGRCTSIEDARKKIRRLLDGDQQLINSIRNSQHILLEPMMASNCVDDWRVGLERILTETRHFLEHRADDAARAKRVVVFCDRNTEAKATHLAQILNSGSKASGEDVEITVAVERGVKDDATEDFRKKPSNVKLREFTWKHLDPEDAMRVLAYTGGERKLTWSSYLVPDDGINNFLDCDLWILIASEIDTPLLPLRPLILAPDSIAHRFGPRKQRLIAGRFGLSHSPEAVIVDSKIAETELINCEGAPEEIVYRLPTILFDEATERTPVIAKGKRKQFLWIVNPRSLQNIEAGVEALSILYNQLGFTRHCRIVIADVEKTALKTESHPKFKKIIDASLKKNNVNSKYVSVSFLNGQRQLSQEMSEADFLWRPGKLDDDLMPVLTFAKAGKPIVAAQCPLLLERIGERGWGIQWTAGENADEMAAAIAQVFDENYSPPDAVVIPKVEEDAVKAYWGVVYECL